MAISVLPLVAWTLICWSTINVVSGAIQLDFRVTPAVVKPLETTNVTLQCLVNEVTPYYNNQHGSYYYNELGQYVQKPNPPPSGDKSSLAMIRILKNLQSKWQAIAQISNIAPTLVHKLDASVNSTDGAISDDPTRRSFIQVTWDVATSDAFGTYRCDTITFDSLQNAVLTTSSDLSLGSSLNALALLRLLKHDMTSVRETSIQQKQDKKVVEQLRSEWQGLKTKTEQKQRELDEKISQRGDLLKVEVEKMKEQIDKLEDELSKKLEDVGSMIDMVLNSGFLMLWPRGSYGLLQPESGCPVGGGTSWLSGSVKQHTESTDRNKDELSTETHLRQPALERVDGNNFLTQHFCIKASSNLLGPNWPNGSYCINKKGNCPDRFNEGRITWDEENDLMLRTSNGSLPDVILNATGTTTISYCCRQDGPESVPIYLPTSDPFYLYRYGGKCQQVHGMKVTEEFMVFDTENRDNCDELGKVHPEGTINNVRLELCYYQRI